MGSLLYPALLLIIGTLVGLLVTYLVDAIYIYARNHDKTGDQAMRKNKKKDAEAELQRIVDERNRVWMEIEKKKKEKRK